MKTIPQDNKLKEKKAADLTITRIFEALRERVWKAWTEPRQVMRWWGPRNFISPSCKIDFRVGGKYVFCMRSDSGPEIWQKGLYSTGVYTKIVPRKRIEYTDSFADENGRVVPSTHYGMEGMPLELEVTLIFEDVKKGQTRMTLRHRGLPAAMKDMCKAGWNESLDKLAGSLE